MKLFLIIYFSLLIVSFNNLIAQDNKKDTANIIKVMYFHAEMRCQACLTIEKFTEESLKGNFEKELKNGKITWESINFQDEQNEHFQDDYKFDTQTLIISKFKDGKQTEWKNLEKIWELNSDFSKFREYVIKEIKEYL